MAEPGRTQEDAGLEPIDRVGVAWSVVAFGVAAMSGLALNLVVSRVYGVDTLGRFNVLLAVFMIGGQVGAMGVQASVLYHTPRARTMDHPTHHVIRAALSLNLVSSLVVTSAVVGIGLVVTSVIENETYRSGLVSIAAGLFLFPLNKSLLAHINGLRRIRAYSLLFAARYLLLIAVVAAMAASGVDGDALTWSVSIVELAMLVALVAALFGELRAMARDAVSPTMQRELLRFGLRGLTGGLLLDLNTRVDVLILGAMAGSAAVGRYSIASVFAEGLYQLALVTRSTFDPLVASLHTMGRDNELRKVVQRGGRRVYSVIVPLGVLSMIVYPIVASRLFTADDSAGTWSVYVLLSAGVVLSAGFIPFTSLLQQTGHPSSQSYLLGLVAGTNVVLNLALVPLIGVNGSALATGVAQAMLVPYLVVLVNRHLGYRIW
jgi:O-antigen/teichoic acid export membrane protein